MTGQADFTEGQNLQRAARGVIDQVTSREQRGPVSIFCQFYHPIHGHAYQKWSLWRGERGGEGAMYEEGNMETYITIRKIDSYHM